MRTSRAIFLILLCLLSAGLIVTCGDDDDGNGGSEAEEFIASADDVCTNAAEESVANPLPTPTSAEEGVPYLKTLIQRREDVLAAFEDLGEPPSEIADEWEQYIAIGEQRLQLIKQGLKLSQQGVEPTDPRFVTSVGKASDLEQEGNAIAEGLGSTACAQVLAPEDRQEIVEFVTFWETEPFEPGTCDEYNTQDNIDAAFGSLQRCEKQQRELREAPEDLTKSLKVVDVEGIAEVTATVDAALTGGINDGSTLRYSVVYEDGNYKMDSVTLVPDETS